MISAQALLAALCGPVAAAHRAGRGGDALLAEVGRRFDALHVRLTAQRDAAAAAAAAAAEAEAEA